MPNPVFEWLFERSRSFLGQTGQTRSGKDLPDELLLLLLRSVWKYNNDGKNIMGRSVSDNLRRPKSQKTVHGRVFHFLPRVRYCTQKPSNPYPGSKMLPCCARI